MADFPQDSVYEILSRAPLEVLDAFKAVSSEWSNVVHSSDFMAKYCKNTDTTFGFYVQLHMQKFISLDHKEGMTIRDVMSHDVHDPKILASSKQGILCVVGEKKGNYTWTMMDRYRFYVCKPCTKQWQALPNPKLRFRTVRVALVVMHSEPLEYKIIRLSKLWFHRQNWSNTRINSLRCEIFESKTWRWRSAEDIILPKSNDFCDGYNISTVSVQAGGLIYWQTSENIVAFNPTDETHSMFPMPELRNFDCRPSLIEYEGKLGLIYSVRAQRYVELWVMDDSRTRNWSLVKQGQQLPIAYGTYGNYPMVLKGFYNRDIALLASDYQTVLYNLEKSCVEEAVNLGSHNEVFPFRYDSKPVNLRGAALE